MKLRHVFLGAVLFAAFISRNVSASEPTALELIKKGNPYVGVQSKDKVVQIRSEKSVASLVPNIWYVVYYDPDATFKATEVKFEGGEKSDVSRPWRMIEQVTGDKDVLDRSKISVDSDQALKIAKSQPLLANLTLKASQLWLEHGDLGPQWRVKLWAAKLAHPAENADIGVVVISAANGTVIKTDLHPNSVD
jgi:hypothetical protein